MKTYNYKKILFKKYSWLAIIFLVSVIFFNIGNKNVNAEWQEPNSPPPGEVFYAPLTTTGEPQAKEGYLLLDPENYHPTEDISLDFEIQRPLVIMGEGFKFSTPYVYGDKLIVDTDTLYVDSMNENENEWEWEWVGIGTSIQEGTEMLKIEGGTVQIGSSEEPIPGRAVSSNSNDDLGILSNAGTIGVTGIYGLRTMSNGWAVYGQSQGANSGVRGESVDGIGIYATNDSFSDAAVFGSNYRSGWAGYFDGRLGVVSDIVADRFLPTSLQKSLIPFTSGQKIGEYKFGDWSGAGARQSADLVFDGTYVWAITSADDNSNSLFKIRASDGAFINSYDLGYSDPIFGLTYDGKYLWFVYNDGSLVKFNPLDGSMAIFDIGLYPGYPSKTLALSEEGGVKYIWAYKAAFVDDNSFEAIIKVNVIDGTVIGTYSIDDIAGDMNDPSGIVYDGDYVWISVRSGHLGGVWAEDPDDVDHPVRNFDTIVSGQYNCVPDGVEFDGEYIWCMTGNGASHLIRIWAEDPTNIQHSPEIVGQGMSENLDNVKVGVFDGTYFWAVDSDDNNIYRFLLADTSQYEVFDTGTWFSDEIIFDGTYIWLAEVGGSQLHKYFTGTGKGHTDLNTVVNLDPANQQVGNFNVSGTSEIDSDITVGTDVDITNNVWGGIADEIIDVVLQVANCSEGLFIKGVEIGADNKISKIHCREL